MTHEAEILGVRFDLVSRGAVLEAVRHWRHSVGRYITITNPHSVMLCRRDEKMRRATGAAALTLPDGVGIILAAKLLGYRHVGRITGPGLMLRICDRGRGHGYRHYFYGAAEGVADRLAQRLSEMFPGLQVAGTHSPPFRPISNEEDAEIIATINSTKPDVVWVGLGAPKQEKWMAAHQAKIRAGVMIGVGAAFDFHAGTVKRAPACMRRIGLEWLHRLLRQPKRMWRRNLDSPLFLSRVIAQRISRAFCCDPHCSSKKK